MSVVYVCPPPVPKGLRMSTVLAVGFGFVTVTRDGENIWRGDDEHVWLRRFERRAAEDPGHDWRVEFYGPLSGSIYQRQGPKHWVLIEKNPGFA